MDKINYEEIAKILKKSISNMHISEIAVAHNHCVAFALADYFEKEDNKYLLGIDLSQFDRKRFLKQCGVKDGM